MTEPRFGLDPEKAHPVVRASLEPIIRFFAYHDAHPIALGMVLMEKFQTEWLEWDAEVLRFEIIDVFKATSVSEHNWQKIQAFRTLMLSIGPFEEWHIFEKVVQALNNNIPDMDVLQRCTLSQLMAGVDMIHQIRDEPLSSEVAGYIAACAIDAGVTYLPPPLDFALPHLSDPHYECLDCGNIDRLDKDQKRCDVCSERFHTIHPFSGKPAEHVPAERGTKIKTFLVRDPNEVKKRFEKLKGLKEADIEEGNIVDVQAAKLVVAHQYMLRRREELVQQLEELKSWVKH